MNLLFDLAVLLSALSFTSNGGVVLAGNNDPFNSSSSSSPKKQQPKGVPKRDVVLTLSTKKTSYAANEPVLIDVTLRNNEEKKPAKILDWVVPCSNTDDDDLPTEMSFFDIKTQSTHHVAKYLGAVFKRLEPKDNDYKILQPGEEISCTIDLSEYYKFDAEANDNEYSIVYEVDSMQLSSPNDGNAYGLLRRQLETLQSSNTLNVTIDSRPDKEVQGEPKRAIRGLRGIDNNTNSRELQSGATNFNSCDSNEQTALIEARTRALTISTEVVNHLFSVGKGQTTDSCPRYETWFGTYDTSRHAELYSGYENIRDDLNGANILFDCGCNEGYFAYVYPSRPYEIFLCNAFWTAPMLGYNSKMGTVVHEISHFTIVAGTDDHAYGASACRDLAISNPNQAINNADNHEYMAENASPNLTCEVGSPAPTAAIPPPTPCPGTDLQVQIDLKVDNYPEETTWTLTNTCTNTVVQSFQGSSAIPDGTQLSDSYCVPAGAYRFTINDSYGDGICCGYGLGNYKIFLNGNNIVSATGEFAQSETTTFGPPCPSNPTNPPTKVPTPNPTPAPPPTKTPTAEPTNPPTTNKPTANPTPNPTNSPVPPTPPPTSKPTNTSVDKYICHKWSRSDSEICSTGYLLDNTCPSAGVRCGGGGKVCQVANCPGGSGPTPPPATPPPSPSGGQCLAKGSTCPSDASRCCSGFCERKGRNLKCG